MRLEACQKYTAITAAAAFPPRHVVLRQSAFGVQRLSAPFEPFLLEFEAGNGRGDGGKKGRPKARRWPVLHCTALHHCTAPTHSASRRSSSSSTRNATPPCQKTIQLPASTSPASTSYYRPYRSDKRLHQCPDTTLALSISQHDALLQHRLCTVVLRDVHVHGPHRE